MSFFRPFKLRSLIAAVAALSIGAAGLSTPAQANSDFDKLILGAVGLAVVGAAINDAKKSEKRREAERYRDRHPHAYHAPKPHRAPHVGAGCVRAGHSGKVVCGQRVASPRHEPPRAGWHHNRGPQKPAHARPHHQRPHHANNRPYQQRPHQGYVHATR